MPPTYRATPRTAETDVVDGSGVRTESFTTATAEVGRYVWHRNITGSISIFAPREQGGGWVESFGPTRVRSNAGFVTTPETRARDEARAEALCAIYTRWVGRR